MLSSYRTKFCMKMHKQHNEPNNQLRNKKRTKLRIKKEEIRDRQHIFKYDEGVVEYMLSSYRTKFCMKMHKQHNEPNNQTGYQQRTRTHIPIPIPLPIP